MSTEETQVSAEVISKARTMGWMPKDQYKGNPDHWLDAAAYVKKGEEFIPFLRANNRRQEEEIRSLRDQLTENQRLLRANDAALKELQTVSNEQTRATAEASRDELITGIEAARKDGDIRTEEELRGRLNETNAKLKAAEKKGNGDGTVTTSPTDGVAPKGATAVTEDFTKRQDWQDWVHDNPWADLTSPDYDPAMLAAANALLTQLISRREITADMTPRQRWDKVAEMTKKRFGVEDNPRRSAPARVEGGRPSGEGGGSGGGGGGKTFDDLPADAKAACDKQSRDPRLVGKGKKYPDVAAYRQYYLGMYFGE